MKTIKAIHNHVIFTFEQDSVKVEEGSMSSTAFQEKTDWGFEFKNFNESTEQPRWGTVVATGPKTDPIIIVGMRILIENLKWTNGIEFNGTTIWRTDDECILAYE